MKAHRVGLGLALGLVSGTLGWLGCGGDDNATLFQSPDAALVDTSVPQKGDSASPGTDAGTDSAPEPNPACIPAPVATPVFQGPSGYPRTDCSSAEITALLTDCFNPTFDQAKCASDKQTYADCAACIGFGDGGTTGSGPLLPAIQGVNYVNYPGCIAIETSDAGPASCGGAQGTLLSCINQSCASCPPDDGGATISQINACDTNSAGDGGPCSSYATGVGTSCASLPKDVASTCYRQATDTTFASYAGRVAGVFCGSSDAGLPEASTSDDGGDAGPAPADAATDG